MMGESCSSEVPNNFFAPQHDECQHQLMKVSLSCCYNVEEGSSGGEKELRSEVPLMVEQTKGGVNNEDGSPNDDSKQDDEEWRGWKEELFTGNWADEVEMEEEMFGEPSMLLHRRSTSNSRTPATARPNPSVNINQQKQKKPKKKKKKGGKKKGFKLFFGGLIFADLEERLFEMEESMGEEVEPEILFAACDTLKKLRIDCFVSMFEEFGKVLRIQPQWEKRYCHVIYEKEEEAWEAFQVLGRPDERKKRQIEFRATLEAAELPRFAAPRPNFYVRWPRGSALESKKLVDGQLLAASLSSPSAVSSSMTIQQQGEEGDNSVCYYLTVTDSDARWELLNHQPAQLVNNNSNTPTDNNNNQKKNKNKKKKKNKNITTSVNNTANDLTTVPVLSIAA